MRNWGENVTTGRTGVRMGPGEMVQAAAMARRFYLEGKSRSRSPRSSA